MLTLDEFKTGFFFVQHIMISRTVDSPRRLLTLSLADGRLLFPLIPDLNSHPRFLLDLCIPTASVILLFLLSFHEEAT
jgi:hypothetical protein